MIPCGRFRTGVAMIAALTMLLVSGCDDDTVTPTPTTSGGSPAPSTPASPAPSTPTATPSPIPKPSPPVIPATATSGLTVASAEAFARYYLEAIDYATATGDVALLKRWGFKDCGSCKQLADLYQRKYANGGSVTGDSAFSVSRVSSVKLIGDDTAAVLIAGRYGRHIDVRSAGVRPTPYSGGSVSWDLTLAAADGHWTMFSMVRK